MGALSNILNNSSAKSCLQNRLTTSIKSASSYNSENDVHLSSNLPSTSVHKNKLTKLLITTDLTHPQQIGLNVNTNVHFKPKKRRYYKHFINELLILILTIYAIVSYLEIQSLKNEVQEIKIHLRVVEETVRLQESVKSNVQAIEKDAEQNYLMDDREARNHLLSKRDAEIVDDVGKASANCSGNVRFTRSVARGKHSHSKNRNGCHSRCLRTSGPLAIHLKGALNEITARDGGVIAPWYIDKSSSGRFLLANGIVGEKRGVLEVVEEGLYYIYAQIYYLTTSSINSYAINVQLGEGHSREVSIVAVCSAEATVMEQSELSCFTASVRYLRRGDRLYLTQRERNRRIVFRDNQSFLGLVLLNSHDAGSNQ